MRYNLLNRKMKILVLAIGSAAILFSPLNALADELPLVRAFYRLDGGVSITHFAPEACLANETVEECMDRITLTIAENGLLYDDMPPDQLPQDRTTRDKWRGEKGKGVWVDETLVTKQDKRNEYRAAMEAELDKDNPNASRVLKLQRLIERVNDLPNAVLSAEELASLEGGQGAVADVLEAVHEGILSLRSALVGSLSVGSAAAPAGITVYDIKTGEPYCLVVEGSAIRNLPGECQPLPAAPPAIVPPSVTPPVTTSPAEPPSVEIPPVDPLPVEPEPAGISEPASSPPPTDAGAWRRLKQILIAILDFVDQTFVYPALAKVR
jgi:hypothetical protein